MNLRNLRLAAIAAILPALFPSLSMGEPSTNLRHVSGKDLPARPPRAAASMASDPGSCIQFLSVFVPAQGGHYVVGLSFTYRDMNGDGAYTPGSDRLDVCVNCQDACGWGP